MYSLEHLFEPSRAFDHDLRTHIQTEFRGSTIESAPKHFYQVAIRSLRQFNAEQDWDIGSSLWMTIKEQH